jgi:hypothetical protein
MSCHENEALAEKLMDHYLGLGYSEAEAEALTIQDMDFADRPTVDETETGGNTKTKGRRLTVVHSLTD